MKSLRFFSIKFEYPPMCHLWILLTLFLGIHQTHAKILIFTYAYNRPDFIELQHKTFKRFLQNDYEFIVFNDAALPDHYQAIHDICKELNLTCIDIPQEIHNRPYLDRPSWGDFINTNQPSVRNSTVVQYSLDTLGFNHDDILMLVDSDIFLIKEFNIRQYMDGYVLASFLKSCCTTKIQHSKEKPHILYLWIGLVFINMGALPNKTVLNFNCGTIEKRQVDAGGFTANYLNNFDVSLVRPIKRTCLQELMCDACLSKKNVSCSHTTHMLQQQGFNKETIAFIQNTPLLYDKNKYRNTEFFLDGTFVHYRAGSNYNNIDTKYSIHKTQSFNNLINALLNS